MEKGDIAGIIDKLVIMPDTNVLLFLYKCSFNANQNIIDLLNKVKDKVVIPSRVYKEYMSHKDEEQAKIDRKYDKFTKDLKNYVTEMKSTLGKNIAESRKYEFPNCDILETGINTFLDKTIQAITTYGNSLSSEKQNRNAQQANVEQIIQYWRDNEKIMDDITIVRLLKYIQEGELRFRYKMPPGYMDEEEKDKETKRKNKVDEFEARIRKYGDLFIWKEVLEFGKNLTNGEKIIFLTNDVKEDWWVLKGEQDNKTPVCMREELKQEYVATTGNDRIEFLTLSNFYELFSDYYKICDIKTSLELACQTYVSEYILSKYEEDIYSYVYEGIASIEWDDINPDFQFVEEPEVGIDRLNIKDILLHYDDDGEAAFYDVELSAPTYPIYIEESLDGDSSLAARVELELILSFQIQRDLRNLDEDAISFRAFSYNVLSNRDAWELYLEAEADAKAEMDDTLEDYYNH